MGCEGFCIREGHGGPHLQDHQNAGRMGGGGGGRQDYYHPSSLWWCGVGGVVVVWWTRSDEWSGTHQIDARFGPCLKSQDFEDGRHRVSPWVPQFGQTQREYQGVTHRPATANERQVSSSGHVYSSTWDTPFRGFAYQTNHNNSMCASRFNYEVTASIAGRNLVCQSVKMVADGDGWNVGRTEKVSCNNTTTRTTLPSSQDSEVLPRPQGCNFHTTQFLRQNTNFSVEGDIRMESWHCVWGSWASLPRLPKNNLEDARTPCGKARGASCWEELGGVCSTAAVCALSLCSRKDAYDSRQSARVHGSSRPSASR